jgi:hypothetical protein
MPSSSPIGGEMRSKPGWIRGVFLLAAISGKLGKSSASLQAIP